jgi:integrase
MAPNHRDQPPPEIAPARASRLLIAREFHRLADVPPEVEWFVNLTNSKTRRAYSTTFGFEIGAHVLRAIDAANALDHQADIAKVQERLGHANIATTRIYDHRRTRPEGSRTFKVAY